MVKNKLLKIRYPNDVNKSHRITADFYNEILNIKINLEKTFKFSLSSNTLIVHCINRGIEIWEEAMFSLYECVFIDFSIPMSRRGKYRKYFDRVLSNETQATIYFLKLGLKDFEEILGSEKMIEKIKPLVQCSKLENIARVVRA